MWVPWLCLATALVGLGDAFASQDRRLAGSTDILYSYVLVGPENVQIARAIVPGDAKGCPDIRLTFEGGKVSTHHMNVRARPDRNYMVWTCEFEVSADATAAELVLEHRTRGLPLLSGATGNIYVVGDTGCRLDGSHTPQACRNTSDWSFAPIMHTISKERAGVLVHIGDYMYREEACPANAHELCGGSPFGATFAAWEVDFFEPAVEGLLLHVWIFIRGNHEECKREAGAEGYFRFLYHGPYTPWKEHCPHHTEPYYVSFRKWLLLVLDTSVGTVEHPVAHTDTRFEQMVDLFDSQFQDLFEKVIPQFPHVEAYIMTHRPVFGMRKNPSTHEVLAEDFTLQTAMSRTLRKTGALPGQLRAFFSGHTHLMQALLYSPPPPPAFNRRSLLLQTSPERRTQPQPPQLYVGNSGTSLAAALSQHQIQRGAPNGAHTPRDGFSMAVHGFGVLHEMQYVGHTRSRFAFCDVNGRVLESTELS